MARIDFDEVHPTRFVVFQWRCPPIVYLLYRVILMIYTGYWLIYTADNFANIGFEQGSQKETGQNNTSKNNNGTDNAGLYAWPVYLTNWTYLLLWLYLTSHAVSSAWYLLTGPIVLMESLSPQNHRQLFDELQITPSLWEIVLSLGYDDDTLPMNGHDLPWYFKLVWILFNMASAGCVMMTAFFFILNTSTIGQMNLQLHGINSVIIFIEYFLSAVPCRVPHYVFGFLYVIAYLTFSGIFYAAGNDEPIYLGIFDWSRPGNALLVWVLIDFVLLPILQMFFFFIYKLRLLLFYKLTKPVEGPSVSDEGSVSYTVEKGIQCEI